MSEFNVTIQPHSFQLHAPGRYLLVSLDDKAHLVEKQELHVVLGQAFFAASFVKALF